MFFFSSLFRSRAAPQNSTAGSGYTFYFGGSTSAKGRILKAGESQRESGTYMYRYADIRNTRRCVYAATLGELRDKEKKIQTEGYTAYPESHILYTS